MKVYKASQISELGTATTLDSANTILANTAQTDGERIAILMRQTDELQKLICAEVRRVETMISSLENKTNSELHALDSNANLFKDKVIKLTTSGLDVQIFGVLLLVYGSLSIYLA